MSNKHNKVYRILNYTEHLLILISTVTGCVFISAFASLVGISIIVGICVIIVGIKKYKSIIKKKKKKLEKIVWLAKSKLKSVEVLISKALIATNISHDEFVLINNIPKESQIQ